MKFTPDAYTLRARLSPAFLVALPLGLATLAWFPGGLPGWALLWSLIVSSGGTVLLAQIGRDWGKKKEPELFRMWGGKPTTRLLRYRDAPNKVVLVHRHNKLQLLLTNVKIPTPEEERADLASADEVYDTCTTFLRDRTRDRKKFDLVFEENCNYGFRRNLWGMKPLGTTAALVGTIAIAILIVINYARGISTPPIVFLSGLGTLLFLLGWLWLFTPDWVKVAAEAYAERLLEASDEL